ncbi:hypothetical protein TNIN_457091 [Trichonephila inaurata madagascariensis]|uniref:Uncharacterized protein n=1 Tax=Trichonephila inaurata madagascariensis TaxID=2747483 RepID=A0A8X7CRY8_9ARAC|nr:hypothetical protein TNIN_457091 [Trichonephila inaurata madagascariensis]
MAPRTVDAAAVQKDTLGVDELLSKLVTLEDQLASLKLQRKVRSSRPHHHQRSRSRSKSRRRYNPQGRYCYCHFRFGKKCLPVGNQNEQTSVGQKNETSNLKELCPLPDEQPTTSCGRKIKKTSKI